jgi:glycerophosphoryl diester phosphodiesterase
MRTSLAAWLATAWMGVAGLSMGGAAQAADGKIVIAHRGASGYLPEHTLAAKAAAHAMGADYIEQDVVLSKDGVPVVLHDVQIDTTTDVAARFPGRARADGRFYAIDFTLAELRTLAVTERFDPQTGAPAYPGRFPKGASAFGIPTLAEEIELIQGMNRSTGRTVGIYPEIKAPAWHRAEGQDISRIVLEVLARYGYREQADPVVVQGFDWQETRRIRAELGYRGRLVQLIGENRWREAPGTDYDHLRTAQGLAEIAAVADGIGPWMAQIVRGRASDGTPEVTDLVARAHAAGLIVHPYTFRADALPDYAASFEEVLELFLLELGVDGVFTDHPDRAVAVLRRAAAAARDRS